MSPCVTTVHLRSTDAKLRIVGALVLFCFWICFEWRTEHFDDMCGQTFFDFLVARNRLRNLVCRIGIPIVLLAVPNKNATQAFDGTYEVGSLHATITSSTLRIPGS